MSRADWRDDLRALVDRAAVTEGRALVARALRDESERLSGESGARRLVVEVPVLGVVEGAAGWVGVVLAPERPPAVLAARTLDALLELARESSDLAIAAIGQPPELSDVQRGERIGQLDAFARLVEIIEVDPTASFSKMAGGSLRTDRREAEGTAEPHALLAGTGLTPPTWFRGSGFGEHDLLDACAAAWTAARRASGEAERGEGRSGAIWV